MSIIKKTFEVDKFLTRELLLRNPDNSYPSVNQVILTDGNGGTYYAPLNPTIPTTGFNEITLVDSHATFLANKPFNNLNIKQGAGVLISKQTISNQDYLTFQVDSLIPSSFYAISTATGTVYANSQATTLNLAGINGIEVFASTNTSVYIGGTANFGIINLSTSNGAFSLIPSTSISSVTIQEGRGIRLTKTNISSFSITNTISSALNSIIAPDGTTLNFNNSYNQIILSTVGTNQINVINSTLTFTNYAFSSIQIPYYSSGSLLSETLDASTVNNSLIFAPGYGITYSTVNSQLQINTSLPSSFSIISTSRGIVSAYNSVNTLTLNNGYGIDYDVNSSTQTISVKLASTFVSQISTERGVISANTQSIINLRQGKSIIYSTSSDNALYINSKDYNRVDIVDGTSGLITTSLFATLNNKTFQFVQGPGMSIVGNSNNNQITMASVNPVSISGPQYAFTYLKIYSTAAYLGQNLSAFQQTQTINAPPVAQAVFGIAPVFPLQSQTDVANNNVYIGLDTSSLLFSTNVQLNILNSLFTSYQMNPSTLSLTVSTLSSLSIQTKRINVSTLYVGESLVLTNTPTISSLFLASNISSIYNETALLCPSTIGSNRTSNPLMVFNYSTNQVGINLFTTQPQATLQVGGTILAENFASYSDSSLKNFKSPYTIDKTDLEALRPWNFTWKNNEQDDVGFAAEDVEKILPSAVRRGPNGLRMVDYGRLSVVSLAALRHTNQRLESIESTLQSLTSKL